MNDKAAEYMAYRGPIPNAQLQDGDENTIPNMSNVKRIADAYAAMLEDRFSSSSKFVSRSHIFYDYGQIHRNTNRIRSRAYRQSPNDKRWLTWDAAQGSQMWLSDPNIDHGFSSYDKGALDKDGSVEDDMANPAPDEGVCDISPTSTWLGVEFGPAGRHSTTSSLGSSGLADDDFILSRSSSCSFLSGRDSRSVSTDSAVEVDLLPLRHKYTLRKQSPLRSVSYEHYDKKPIKKTVRSESCDLPERPHLPPPSVVISDHSGDAVSYTIAHLNNDFRISGRTSSPSFVSEPLNELGLYVCKVCPRKVSDCSTCSSVSTVDMSPESHLSLDDFLPSRKTSCCSNCSAYTSPETIEEEDSSGIATPETILERDESKSEENTHAEESDTDKTSNWRILKNVVQWTPFVQTYRKKKYPWVQLAGHQGNFKAGEKQGTILKKFCPTEHCALEKLMKDNLKPFVPEYMGLMDSSDSECYLQLQDLLSDFNAPCVMDIKMGVRTYLEDELAKAREKPKLRKDMYEKMVQIDPDAPSEAEHKAQAVTKPRYMVWRETISSTATLGFRIEGVRKSDGSSSKDFKTTRSQEQVMKALAAFMDGFHHAPKMYLNRLKSIRNTLESSQFFMSHELIGSSLLFVHNEDNAVVWLIDFAKSIPLPEGVKVTHKSPWVEGSHEDGYLLGLDNLISLMTLLEEQQNTKLTDSLSKGLESHSLHNVPIENSLKNSDLPPRLEEKTNPLSRHYTNSSESQMSENCKFNSTESETEIRNIAKSSAEASSIS